MFLNIIGPMKKAPLMGESRHKLVALLTDSKIVEDFVIKNESDKGLITVIIQIKQDKENSDKNVTD
mgnify:CR=1 FL=1